MDSLSERNEKIAGRTLSIEDLKALLAKLQQLVDGRLRIALDRFESRFQGTADEKETVREKLVSGHKIWISIYGSDGEVLIERGLGSIAADQLPRRIERVYASSLNPHKYEFNIEPIDGWLELQLDFRDGPILDWRHSASAPTPNESYILAKGDRAWTGAVIQCVEDQLLECRNHREALHRSFVYDALLVLIGLPTTFLVLFRVSPFVSRITGNEVTVLSAALNTYLFFAILWGFRVLFAYSRWVFPLMEIESHRNRRAPHRVALGVILAALASEIIHSMVVAFA